MELLWTIRPPAPEQHFARFADLPWPVAQVLFNRKLTNPSDVAAFFARQAEQDNPFHLRGMTEAVTRIRAAIERGERILVHGDFDADGVTSTAVMVTGLHAMGAEVAPYIPHRVDEGYGLNEEAVHKMKRRSISLMVTVDCGIRAHNEIELANELGIDVVVTDHHSPSVLPPAYAIVNPHQEGCEYPHKMLAGVGLAWKTIQALTLAERKRPLGRQREPVDLEELLSLVALGTVADIAPLTGENRKLVWRGLAQLQQTRRPGLLALMARARVRPEEIDAESIGFTLGPRINAAGRLDHAKTAYQMLRAQKPEDAYQLAEELEQLNRLRQDRTQEALRRAATQIGDPTAPLLLVSDERCPEGIVGLVAGRLLEQFYRPTIVISQGPEWSRASCRSIAEFHITKALDSVAHLLERHGGHAAAAGFTVRTENLPALEAELRALAEAELRRAAPGGDLRRLAPRLTLDAELPLHEIDDTLVDALEQLAPFGAENSVPLWMSHDVRVQEAQAVGRDGAHLKLTLLDAKGRAWKAIAFRLGHRLDTLPERLDIAFQVKRSEWKGRSRLELQISDLRPVQQQGRGE